MNQGKVALSGFYLIVVLALLLIEEIAPFVNTCWIEIFLEGSAFLPHRSVTIAFPAFIRRTNVYFLPPIVTGISSVLPDPGN